MGALPKACTASHRKGTRRERASAPISATGWSAPVSLLAYCTQISRVSGRRARSTASGWVRPFPSGGITVTSPACLRAAFSTEACSTAPTMAWPPFASVSAWLLPSVPLAVNSTSWGRAFSMPATV